MSRKGRATIASSARSSEHAPIYSAAQARSEYRSGGIDHCPCRSDAPNGIKHRWRFPIHLDAIPLCTARQGVDENRKVAGFRLGKDASIVSAEPTFDDTPPSLASYLRAADEAIGRELKAPDDVPYRPFVDRRAPTKRVIAANKAGQHRLDRADRRLRLADALRCRVLVVGAEHAPDAGRIGLDDRVGGIRASQRSDEDRNDQRNDRNRGHETRAYPRKTAEVRPSSISSCSGGLAPLRGTARHAGTPRWRRTQHKAGGSRESAAYSLS